MNQKRSLSYYQHISMEIFLMEKRFYTPMKSKISLAAICRSLAPSGFPGIEPVMFRLSQKI